jgi:glycosyltransferase involved in cell wall biosynthesis
MLPRELISVIVPTYNRQHFVANAVESVLRQDAGNVEIVVVDDGSTDNTAAVLVPLMKHIRYIHQENRGVSAARNRGVRESRGEYLAFLDSDDEWAPEKLPAQMGAVLPGTLSFEGVRWLLDGKDVADANLGVKWPRAHSSGFVIDPVQDVAEGRYLHLGTLLCRKEDFLRVGLFDEGLTFGEDEDWFSRASLKMRFHYLPQPLLIRRLHGSQTDMQSEANLRSLISVLSRIKSRTERGYPLASSAANRRLAAKWSHLANSLRRGGQRAEAARAARTAYRLEPLNFKRLVKAAAYL